MLCSVATLNSMWQFASVFLGVEYEAIVAEFFSRLKILNRNKLTDGGTQFENSTSSYHSVVTNEILVTKFSVFHHKGPSTKLALGSRC